MQSDHGPGRSNEPPPLGLGGFWEVLPSRSLAIFLAGVFLAFGASAFAIDLFMTGRQSWGMLALSAVIHGGFAIGYALIGIRRSRQMKLLLPSCFFAHVLLMTALYSLVPPARLPRPLGGAQLAALQVRLVVDGVGLLLLVSLAYVCFVWFMTKEGGRYFHYQAEVALASEIHRLLVPRISLEIGRVELYGESRASSEVGGDLVDVVAADGVWLAYIADVSGHGVAPGVVMGMVKSAVRTRGVGLEDDRPLLDHLNAVLHPLKKPNMFVTFAYVADRGGELEVALAGHPPILRYRAGDASISEIGRPNLPLGIVPEHGFASVRATWEPGDLLVLVTDGLLEPEDRAGEPFGLERLKRVVREHGGAGLETLARRILRAVESHGRCDDDRSLLLIRKRH